MKLPKRLKKNQTVDITDLYAFRLGALWRAFKVEHLSLWMLCLYFLFEYVRPLSIYPALDILPAGQLVLLATLVAAFMDKSVRMVKNIESNLFIFFSVILFLSALLAFKPSVSLDNWEVFFGWFLIYFLVTGIVNTEKRLLFFLLAYCLFNYKMSQHGAIVWARRGFSFADYGINGAPGWFNNSGEYAIQMVIFGSLAISMVIGLKSYWGRYKKWFFYAAAGTAYMAVMGASSRGSQLALAAIGIWMLLKQRNGLKGLIIIGVLGSALFVLLPDEQMDRFNNMGEDKESLQRLAYWQYGLTEVIPQHPVLGVGYNNWLVYSLYARPEGIGPLMSNQESHNIFIQAASELGITGFIVFILLIIFAFKNNKRTREMAKKIDNKFLFSLSYGLDAGLIGYLVAGSFVTVLYYPFFWVQIAMIVAVNSVTKGLVEEQEGTVKSKRGKRLTRRRI